MKVRRTVSGTPQRDRLPVTAPARRSIGQLRLVSPYDVRLVGGDGGLMQLPGPDRHAVSGRSTDAQIGHPDIVLRTLGGNIHAARPVRPGFYISKRMLQN